MKYVPGGLLALIMALMFTQCSDNKSGETVSAAAQTGVVGLKIAFVEVDSLLSQYLYCQELNELLVKKEENIRATLNERAKELDTEVREFQRKLENNGFASRERAEQENVRLTQKQRDLQQLQEKLTNEFQMESAKVNLQLRDSITSFLKVYNETRGFSLIISKSGFDNLLLGDESLNITDEIVKGLNERYNPGAKK